MRSIQASQSETSKNFNTNRQSKFQKADEKSSSRRVSPSSSTVRPIYKRRTFSTTIVTSTTKPLETSTSRFKINRKSGESLTLKPKSQFTSRFSTQNVLVTTPKTTISPSSSTHATFKKPTRGNYRPKSSKNITNDGNTGDEENYPEHFKALLKNREVITQESDKSVLKKPKPFRNQSTEKTTKASVKIKPNAALYKPRQSRRLSQKLETTSSASTSTTEFVPIKKPTLRMRPSPRPTERKLTKNGSTLQEPPTAMSKPTHASRTPANQIIEEESMNVNTQITNDSLIKQIDPPIQEAYFPRTSAVS